MKALFILALLAQAGAAEIIPAAMSRDQIKAHNAVLDKKDPNYIKCVRYAAPGSLIDNKVSCRTNAQWIQANKTGEQNARDTVDAMRYRLESPPDQNCKNPESC
jgi:hypothetical protein